MQKTLMPFLILMLIAFPAWATAPSAEANASLHTRNQVRETYAQFKASFSGNIYSEQPSATPPFALGEIAPQAIQDALNQVNYARYLAYLPYDTELLSEFNTLSQQGAVLLAAVGQLDHAPKQPEGMDDEFFKRALDSTKTSNLFAANWLDSDLLSSSVLAYMRDESDYNLSRLGHRRWVLSPKMRYTGFGLAESSAGFHFATMQVYDQSAESATYDSICWPSSGAFPADMLSDKTPWSISLNPDLYDLEQSNPQLLLSEESTGASFEFSQWQTPDSFEQLKEKPIQYAVWDTQLYGSGACYIFRPDLSRFSELQSGYAQNQVWNVRLGGLVAKDGQAAPDIAYRVTMVSLTPQAVYGIEIMSPPQQLMVGQIVDMRAQIVPAWADDLSVIWNVSDSKLATIDPQGKLTGLQAGTVKVKASSISGHTDEISIEIVATQ